MRTVSVTWDKPGGRFVALGRHAGQQVAINAPPAPGEARPATGFSATELLLAGAGACAAWDVVEILRKRRASVEALEVSVEAQQDEAPPWTYRRIALHFQVSCDGLTLGVLSRAIRLSIVRYCSVLTTLAGVAAIEATVELRTSDGRTTGRRHIELAMPAAPYPPGLAPSADEVEPGAS